MLIHIHHDQECSITHLYDSLLSIILGTNGYVVRNLSHVRPPPIQNKQKGMDHRGPPPPVKKPNKDLILHDLKRKVEVQCMELRLSMEDDG